MKIIDFHTHAFPDAIASKGLSALLEGCNNIYKPVTDMTINGLLRYMDEHAIDISVIQPVITKPSQTIGLNKWASEIRSDRVTSFGGVHPLSDDYKRDIDFVVSLGLKGLKFHPEYQNFVLDEPKMLKIYDYALSKGLILLFHAGYDPAFPPLLKSTPEKFARLSRELKGGIIVAAHMGGHEQWESVERYLVGTDIYLDTSMGFEFYSHEFFLKITREHGYKKILFASDSPWSDAAKEIETFYTFPLTDEEKEGILYNNARRILSGE